MQITKTTKKQHVVSNSIPKEVVVEILKRVSCQDLYETLKKVCTQWCSIIYSGSFAYSHIERQILLPSFSQLEAVVINRTGDDKLSITVSALELHSFPNYPQDEQDSWKTEHLYTANNVLGSKVNDFYGIRRVNSVNGFICFWSLDVRLHVCNPITKQYFTTPPYTYQELDYIKSLPVAFGFGFCHLSYEYKVVVLHEDIQFEYGVTKPFVFTVGIDRSWRSLRAITDIKFHSRIDTGVPVKGLLYWYVNTCTCTGRTHDNMYCKQTKSLICFDVTKEVVDVVMVPIEISSLEEGGRGSYCAISIAEKGGRLCLVDTSYGPICSILINMYVNTSPTADLSSLNSWKKELTVTLPNMSYGVRVTALCILTVTNDILIIRMDDNWESFGFIDVATGMLLGVLHVQTNSWEIAMPYVPSLVSLFHKPTTPD